MSPNKSELERFNGTSASRNHVSNSSINFSGKKPALPSEIYKSVYRDRHAKGTTSFKTLNDNNRLNKSYKKDLLDNHFEYGGKLLVSPNPDGPIRLLETEKRKTYFTLKPLSYEENALREKFKEHIEK